MSARAALSPKFLERSLGTPAASPGRDYFDGFSTTVSHLLVLARSSVAKLMSVFVLQMQPTPGWICCDGPVVCAWNAPISHPWPWRMTLPLPSLVVRSRSSPRWSWLKQPGCGREGRIDWEFHGLSQPLPMSSAWVHVSPPLFCRDGGKPISLS